jgi:hypothetical protein
MARLWLGTHEAGVGRTWPRPSEPPAIRSGLGSRSALSVAVGCRRSGRELNEAIDPEQDAIIAYQICRACVKEAQSMGLLVRLGPVLVYLP